MDANLEDRTHDRDDTDHRAPNDDGFNDPNDDHSNNNNHRSDNNGDANSVDNLDVGSKHRPETDDHDSGGDHDNNC